MFLNYLSHTDPVCEFFSKNYLMAKLLQNNSNLNDLEYSRHLKVRKIEKKAKKFFEGQTKTRGEKTQKFHNFFNSLRLIGDKNSREAISFSFLRPQRPKRPLQGQYRAQDLNRMTFCITYAQCTVCPIMHQATHIRPVQCIPVQCTLHCTGDRTDFFAIICIDANMVVSTLYQIFQLKRPLIWPDGETNFQEFLGWYFL